MNNFIVVWMNLIKFAIQHLETTLREYCFLDNTENFVFYVNFFMLTIFKINLEVKHSDGDVQ